MSNEPTSLDDKKEATVPVLICTIEGSVTKVRQETPGGVIATTVMKTRDFFESFTDVYKPFHEQKSGFMNILGSNWIALKYHQQDANGNMIVLTEATPRVVEIVADRLNFLNSGDFPFDTIMETKWKPLIDSKRLQIDRARGIARAKIHFPYTQITFKLTPKTTANGKGREKSYTMAACFLTWSDTPVKDVTSDLYTMPLPNIWAVPFSGEAGKPAKICWGDTLRDMEIYPEMLPSLVEKFYTSKFNMDLVNFLWFQEVMTLMCKGPDFDATKEAPNRITMDYLMSHIAASDANTGGRYMAVNRLKFSSVISRLKGNGEE